MANRFELKLEVNGCSRSSCECKECNPVFRFNDMKTESPKRKSPLVRVGFTVRVSVGGLALDTFSVIHNAWFLTAITLNIAITSQLRITNAIENAFNKRQDRRAKGGGRWGRVYTHI